MTNKPPPRRKNDAHVVIISMAEKTARGGAASHADNAPLDAADNLMAPDSRWCRQDDHQWTNNSPDQTTAVTQQAQSEQHSTDQYHSTAWKTGDLTPRRLRGEAEVTCNFFFAIARHIDSGNGSTHSRFGLQRSPDSIFTDPALPAHNFADLEWSAFPPFKCLLISPRIKKSGYFIFASSPTARLPCLLQPAPSTTMFVPLT